MKKVLEFPAAKSENARAFMKADAQRLFLSMSLLSLILVAVISSDHLMRAQRPVYFVSDNIHDPRVQQEMGRMIAEAQPINLLRDLEWEHSLARRLNTTEERLPAAVAQKITLLDDMKYGVLAGRYAVKSSGEGKLVDEIRFDSSVVSDRPILLNDAQNFLTKYRALMAIPYVQVELSSRQDGEQVWHLLNGEKQVVGRARVSFDGQGLFVSAKIESL